MEPYQAGHHDGRCRGIGLKVNWKPGWLHIKLRPMKLAIALLLLFSTIALADPTRSGIAVDCAAIQRTESFRNMSKDELSARREKVNKRYDKTAAGNICASSATLTYEGFKQELELARKQNLEAGGTPYDPAELYFFLECGEDQVNLSPLAYHAFNLSRDDHGFLGEMTLAIVWMSIGYLDIKDPDHDRSFMDAVNRILAYARKQESEAEISMYENLLLEIDGFKEDYAMAVSECRGPGSS